MSPKRWLGWLAFVVATVVLAAYTGHLSAIAPVDRVINPHARHYWQSEEDYFRDIVHYCARSVILEAAGTSRQADACIRSSVRGAIDRDYLSAAWSTLRR